MVSNRILPRPPGAFGSAAAVSFVNASPAIAVTRPDGAGARVSTYYAVRPGRPGQTPAPAPGLVAAYKQGWTNEVMRAVVSGRDRAYIWGPYQTGKTSSLSAIATAFQSVFPGKRALIITPQRAISRLILRDFERFAGRVGRIDAERKDFSEGFDAVIASAYTLGRAEHLGTIDPTRFGLVVVDEAVFAFAPTWQRILHHFGFVDAGGAITRTEGRFLLGLTADPFSLEEIFGPGAQIPSPPMTWFMAPERGLLHIPVGVRVRLDLPADFETVYEGAERLVTPRSSPAFHQAVVALYREKLDRKRAMIYEATIAHAKGIQAAFDVAYGKGYAVALTSEMDPNTVAKIEAAYLQGTGPKVLISVGLLQYGHRGSADGVIIPYAGTSLRRFGQRIGRVLGIPPGEQQREIPIYEVRPSGLRMLDAVSLPRLYGLPDYREDGIAFHPLDALASLQRRPGAAAPRPLMAAVPGTKGLFEFRYEPRGAIVAAAEAVPTILQKALADRFGFDVVGMANACALNLDELDTYLCGALPRRLSVVRRMERALQFAPGRLVHAWTADALRIIEYLRPIPATAGPAVRELILTVRRAVLSLGEGSVRGAAFAIEPSDAFWRLVQQVFNGAMPKGGGKLVALAPLIEASGLADAVWSGRLIAAAVDEIAKVAGRKTDPGLDLDVYDAGIVEPVGRLGAFDRLAERTDVAETRLAIEARDFVAQWMEHEVVRMALGNLSDRRQVAIRGYFWEGKSFEDLGRELEVSRATVGHLYLSHSLRALRGPTGARMLQQGEGPFGKDIDDRIDPRWYRRAGVPPGESAKIGEALLTCLQTHLRPVPLPYAQRVYRLAKLALLADQTADEPRALRGFLRRLDWLPAEQTLERDVVEIMRRYEAKEKDIRQHLALSREQLAQLELDREGSTRYDKDLARFALDFFPVTGLSVNDRRAIVFLAKVLLLKEIPIDARLLAEAVGLWAFVQSDSDPHRVLHTALRFLIAFSTAR